MLYKTRGVVLRRRELGEADLLLTLLSPDHGKIQGVGRSSRKVTARLMGKLEPTMVLDLTLARGKSLDVITEARVTEGHPLIRTDLTRLAYASVLLELFDVVLEEPLDTPEPFALLTAALNLLETGTPGSLVLRWCEIRLVSALGLEPHMEGCVTCDAESSIVFFSVRQGGTVCARCRASDDSAWQLLAGTLAVYRQLRQCSADLLSRLSTERVVERQLEEVMRAHLSYRWPHRLKSLAFLKQVEAMRLKG